MPQPTDLQMILHVARRRGWKVSQDERTGRLTLVKGDRTVTVNFSPDAPGAVLSAFEGTSAIKGRMPGAVIAVLNA